MAEKVFEDVNTKYPMPELTNIPRFNLTSRIMLADNFAGVLRRPVKNEMAAYILTVYVSNGETESETVTRRALNHDILWMSAKLRTIINQGISDEDAIVPHLIWLILYCVDRMQPDTLGQVALFLMMANVCRRSNLYAMWLDLMEWIDDGLHGYPCVQWSISDLRISPLIFRCSVPSLPM